MGLYPSVTLGEVGGCLAVGECLVEGPVGGCQGIGGYLVEGEQVVSKEKCIILL